MTDEANGALDAEDEGVFTDEEQAILRGEEPEGEDSGEQAVEGAEEATDGEEQAAGADQPDTAEGHPADGPAEKPGYVPSSRFREEAEKRRAIESELRKTAEERARYEERLNILLQWAQNQNEQAQQANQPAMPDPNEDPIGYQNAMIGQLQQRLEQQQQYQQQLAQAYQGQQQTQAQQQQRQQMWQTYNNDVQAFASEQPDFADAMQHLQDVRVKELQAMGFQGPQIQQQIDQDFEQFVTMALQNGQRPSQALYELSKARLYQPGASPQQQQAAANAAAQGQQPQGQQQGQQAGDKLRKIAKGQASNKSLSGSGSGSPQPMDAVAIAGMDDEEFGAWYQQNFSDAKLQKMLGY